MCVYFFFLTWTIRESICIKLTEKFFFTQNFVMHNFLKGYGNKLAFIMYTRLEQKPNGAKCE